MIPGLWGAPLNRISGWLPENKTQEFNLEKLIRNENNSVNSNDAGALQKKDSSSFIKPKKYIDILQSEIPVVETFFDLTKRLQQQNNEEAYHD